MPSGTPGRPNATNCEHTDRPNAGLGLCRSCYSRDLYRRKHNTAGRPPRRKAWLCPHPDRFSVGNSGLCENCLQKKKYRDSHPDCVPADTPTLDRFNAFVEELPNGCWKWTGAHKSKRQGGYGMFKDPAHRSPCHAVRWAYEHIRGLKPPKRGSGVKLSHTCKTGSRCVNPFHVCEESHSKNMLRVPVRKRKRLLANARKHIKAYKGPPQKTHCRNGHPRTPDNLYGTHCKICSDIHRKQRRAQAAWVRDISKALGKVA